jgi:hypothetical protein
MEGKDEGTLTRMPSLAAWAVQSDAATAMTLDDVEGEEAPPAAAAAVASTSEAAAAPVVANPSPPPPPSAVATAATTATGAAGAAGAADTAAVDSITSKPTEEAPPPVSEQPPPAPAPAPAPADGQAAAAVVLSSCRPGMPGPGAGAGGGGGALGGGGQPGFIKSKLNAQAIADARRGREERKAAEKAQAEAQAGLYKLNAVDPQLESAWFPTIEIMKTWFQSVLSPTATCTATPRPRRGARCSPASGAPPPTS